RSWCCRRGRKARSAKETDQVSDFAVPSRARRCAARHALRRVDPPKQTRTCGTPAGPAKLSVRGRLHGTGHERAVRWLVPRFRSSWVVAATSDTNFGSKGALAIHDSSAAIRFEVPNRVCRHCYGNFKSAALAVTEVRHAGLV